MTGSLNKGVEAGATVFGVFPLLERVNRAEAHNRQPDSRDCDSKMMMRVKIGSCCPSLRRFE